MVRSNSGKGFSRAKYSIYSLQYSTLDVFINQDSNLCENHADDLNKDNLNRGARTNVKLQFNVKFG